MYCIKHSVVQLRKPDDFKENAFENSYIHAATEFSWKRHIYKYNANM